MPWIVTRRARSSAATGTAPREAIVTAVTIGAVPGELPEGDGVPAAFGDAEDDDVGAGADRGRVAAEVGAERQRPPQRIEPAPGRRCRADELSDDRAMVAT